MVDPHGSRMALASQRCWYGSLLTHCMWASAYCGQAIADALASFVPHPDSCSAAVAVDTVIAVKWNFYCFVSRWHKSVLEVRAAASSPRATARPFGQRGLTPPPASNQGPACDRRLDVAQQPIANAGSKGLPVFRTPKHRTNNLRIAATTICLGLSRPRAFNRVTSATIAGLYRIADIAGM